MVRWLTRFGISDSFYGPGEFVPGVLHEDERFPSPVGQGGSIFLRSSGRFDPVVRYHPVVFHTGQKGIERTFDDDEVAFFERGDDVGSVRLAMSDDHEDGVFQYAFTHLRGYFSDSPGIFCFLSTM